MSRSMSIRRRWRCTTPKTRSPGGKPFCFFFLLFLKTTTDQITLESPPLPLLSVCHQLVRFHGELNHLLLRRPRHLLQVRRRAPLHPRLAGPPPLLTALPPPFDLGVAECRSALLTFSTAFNCCPLPRSICFQCRRRALKIIPAFKLNSGIYG